MNEHETDCLCNTHFSISTRERYFLNFYVLVANVLMISIILIQSHRHEIFEITLMLGWDTHSYVWTARYIITKGPMYMIDAWGFPYFCMFVLRIPSDTAVW